MSSPKPRVRTKPSATRAAPALDLDLQRLRRTGVPEAVFAPGKTTDELIAAARGLYAAHGRVLITRTDAEQRRALMTALPTAREYPRSGMVSVGVKPGIQHELGPVAIVSAGTADQPWAEEAAVTLAHLGCRVQTFPDCGVAGVHRLLKHVAAIRHCVAAVAVAGMDGAMPSVLGGLIDIPLIACPTPIGYGVGAGGHAALHTMLNACAPGVTVVNIGNGFGAAVAAAVICRAVAAGPRTVARRSRAAGPTH